MKILISIPCLHGAEHTRLAIESVINAPDVDLFLIDNGADNDVKAVINYYHSRPNVFIESNPVNVFVNPAWNRAMSRFINYAGYTHLILMNSDLIMRDDWHFSLSTFIRKHETLIPVPVLSNNIHTPDTDNEDYTIAEGGTPGVFIVLNRKQAEFVYPIPQEIKVWFGDNWIYDILRGIGYKTAIPNNLHALHHHGGSQNVSRAAGVYEMIEQDKVNWQSIVHPRMIDKISGHFSKPQV